MNGQKFISPVEEVVKTETEPDHNCLQVGFYCDTEKTLSTSLYTYVAIGYLKYSVLHHALDNAGGQEPNCHP